MVDKPVKRRYPLANIYFYLTEGCNLRCRHCWITPKYQSEGHSYPSLPLDLFKSILEQGKPLGLSTVKLTGGEPLLHPQIHEIIALIHAHNIRLTMETNGILCTPQIAREMAARKGSLVSVSLDGANADIHELMRGVKGCFEEALQGIRNLVKAGLKPQIIMSITRHNKSQMKAVVRLAESLGAGSVKFNIVQPAGRGEKMHEAGETMSIEELVELGQWVEGELSATTGLRLIYSHPIAFRPLGKMFGDKRDGCSLCGILSIIGVLADGSYALCGIGETVPDLIFGHAATDRLKDVWENTPILLELREGLPHRLEGICSNCLLKSICRGCCIAQNYYIAKDLWAPYWYCEEALKKGLFPETRISPKRAKEAIAG